MGRNQELNQPKFIGCNIEQKDLEILDEIRWREHKDRAEVLRSAVEEYIKHHGSGNETFKLEQFQDPNFKAMPATMSSKDQWNEYIRKHMDKKERRELGERAKFMLTIIEAANWIESKK